MIFTVTVPIQKKMDGKWNKIPSLNDFIRAERTTIRTRNGKVLTKGALMKKEWQGYMAIYIGKYLGSSKIAEPMIVHYHYFEPDHKRDYGNIHCTFQKFFEDALQECGTIPNDNQKYITGFTADFEIDKSNPRVVVEIETIGE